MNCSAIREELTALADGALTGGADAVVRAHVAGCGDCAAELSGIQATVDLSRRVLVDELPTLRPGFETRLRARLAEETERGRSRARWWRPAFVGALVAASVLLMARSVGGPSAVLVPLGIQAPPKKVAEKPVLFKDYEIIEHLEELENFETVIQTPLEYEIPGEGRGAG